MKITVIVFLLLLVSVVQAEPIYYVTMRQYCEPPTLTTNVECVVTNYYNGVVVSNIACISAIEATNTIAQYASDPDFFGDSGSGELAWDAKIHRHDHYNPAPCLVWVAGSHRSKKVKLTQWVDINEEGVQDPIYTTRYLFQGFRLDAKNQGQATSKLNRVKAKYPGKSYKSKNHGF